MRIFLYSHGRVRIAGAVRRRRAIRMRNLVGTDGLRNATRLPLGDAGLADIIKERGFAVVHVSHHYHYGGAFVCHI